MRRRNVVETLKAAASALLRKDSSKNLLYSQMEMYNKTVVGYTDGVYKKNVSPKGKKLIRGISRKKYGVKSNHNKEI